MAKTPDTAAPPFKPQDWPAENRERRRVADLKRNPKNAKDHPPEQIRMIAESIKEFGWVYAILIDTKDNIIAGHGRLDAAVMLGLTEVPVIVARGWTAKQKRAYALADNRLAELAVWNPGVLRDELLGLKADGIDLLALGFNDDAFKFFTAVSKAGSADPDEVAAPPAKPAVRPGDLWVLGQHRLACGDATDPKVAARVIGADKPNLMVTDPPYGVKYDPAWRYRVRRSDGSRVGARAVGEVHNDDRDDWRAAWALFPGNVAYVWHGGLHASIVQQSLEAVGLMIRTQIIWAKPQFVIGRGDYHWQHECCWHAVRKGKTGNWLGGRKQTTVWTISVPSGWAQIKEGADAHTGVHSTQKMVECMKRPIENNSKPGDFVYEPFCGSGTTIIACEQTARRALAVELSPAYVQLSIERWEKYTGLKAMLDGRTLEQIKKARAKGRPKGATDEARDLGKPVPRRRAKPADAVVAPPAEPAIREEGAAS